MTLNSWRVSSSFVHCEYFLGRSDSAIGALTGMPRSTVQHHRASALRLLRDVLAGEVEVE